MIEETGKPSYFRLTTYSSLKRMQERISYVLKEVNDEADKQGDWVPYNFCAETLEEVEKTWRGLLTNYAQKNIGRPGRPLKKVGYILVVSPGISHDRYDDLKRGVRDFTENQLRDNFSIAATHFDTNYLHAHILIHSVTVDMRAWRLPPEDLVAFRNSWYASCKRAGLPCPLVETAESFGAERRNGNGKKRKAGSLIDQPNAFLLDTGKTYIPFEDEEDERVSRVNGKRLDGDPRLTARRDRSQN